MTGEINMECLAQCTNLQKRCHAAAASDVGLLHVDRFASSIART